MSSAAPLLQQRVNQSPLISIVLVVVLTGLAFVGVNIWNDTVARTAASMVARQFETAPPIAYARLTYVAVQMFAVAVAALIIATITFRVENGIFRNTASRLGILALVILAPPFIASFGPQGYSMDFLIPWAGAMLLAIAGGAALATRLAGRR